MSNDPEAGRDQTRGEAIEGPERKGGEGIEEGCGKRQVCRGEQWFDVRGGFVDDTYEEKVPNTFTRLGAVMCTVSCSFHLHVETRAERRPLIAVRTN